jgi:glycosyltransferase involved in cell wall biosynthesis
VTKIIYFITEDWFFVSHFIDRAIAAKKSGYDVSVITRIGKHGDVIANAGIKIIPTTLQRRSTNPFREIRAIYRIKHVYDTERPVIVHHVALKPIIYGTIAALLSGIRCIVNAPVGMGFVFSSRQWKAKIAKPIISWLYCRLMASQRGTVIVENSDDQKLLGDAYCVPAEKIRLIRGAGVNPDVFKVTSEREVTPIVILPARMLWDKGVGEFVTAARIIRHESNQVRFVLVGDVDTENPSSISTAQIEEWVAEGVIEWWGFCNDMPDIYAQAHIVCLPSYREGLPKTLLEAAACGRAIVTTDVPGCREIVSHEETGLLVNPRDAVSLAQALERLINSPDLRQRMGKNAHNKIIRDFSSEMIINQTLALYRELLV